MDSYGKPALPKAGVTVSVPIPAKELFPARIQRFLALGSAVLAEVARDAYKLVRNDLGNASGAMAEVSGNRSVPERAEGARARRLRGMPASQSAGLAQIETFAQSSELYRTRLGERWSDYRCSEGRTPDQVLSPNPVHHGRSSLSGRSPSVLRHGESSSKTDYRSEFSSSRLVRA